MPSESDELQTEGDSATHVINTNNYTSVDGTLLDTVTTKQVNTQVSTQVMTQDGQLHQNVRGEFPTVNSGQPELHPSVQQSTNHKQQEVNQEYYQQQQVELTKKI